MLHGGSQQNYWLDRTSNMKTRERLTEVLMSFDEGAVIYGYRQSGDAIEFIGKDGQVLTPSYGAVGSGYQRESGKFKSTSQVVVDPRRLADNVPYWQGRYDRVFAVDTNTIVLDGEVLSVACSVRAEIEFIDNKWNGRIELLDALVAIGPKLKPEIGGWLDLIERVNLDPALKVGIVVDSELGDIPRYNLRTMPLAPGIYLPENVELIYASSDQDKNIPFNFLIAKCDVDARLLIGKISAERSRLQALKPSNSKRFQSHFYWAPKKKDAA